MIEGRMYAAARGFFLVLAALLLLAPPGAECSQPGFSIEDLETLVEKDSDRALETGEQWLATLPPDQPGKRMLVIEQLAIAATQVHAYEQAMDYARDLLALAEQQDEPVHQANAWRLKGTVAIIQGDLDTAVGRYDKALAFYQLADDQPGLALIHGNLGVIHYHRADYASSMEALNRAMLINMEREDSAGLIANWVNIGNVLKDVGETAGALDAYLNALELIEETGDRRRRASVLNNIGLIHHSLDEYESAREAWEEAYEINVEVGDRGRWAMVLGNLGTLDTLDGRYSQAIDKHREAITVLEEIGHTKTAATNYRQMGNAYRLAGDQEEALAAYQAALLRFERMEAHAEAAITRGRIGQTYKELGRLGQALPWLEEASHALDELGTSTERLWVLEQLAQAQRDAGQFEAAIETLYRRLEIGEVMENERRQRQLEVLQVRFEVDEHRRSLQEMEEQRRLQDLMVERQQLQLENQRIIRNSAFGAALGLIVLLGLVWRGYQVKARTARQLRDFATTDSLTGLHNRRHMLDLCEQEIARAERYRHDVSIWIMDLDHFKQVNDHYGHETGDQVLRGIAVLLREQLRQGDLVSRWGGEEFVALLPHTTLESATETAQRICNHVARTPLARTRDGEPVRVTLSIGVASRSGRTISYSAILREADQALYRAKNEGRNRVRKAPS